MGNFEVLNQRCPECGDRLIWNHTGVECGGCVDRNCTYSEGREPYRPHEHAWTRESAPND